MYIGTAAKRTAQGKVLRKRWQLVFVALALTIVTWFAVKLLGLTTLGYVDSAIIRVREVVTAETQFAKGHPDIGFTCSISQLPQNEVLAGLAKGGTENGYAFAITGCRAPERRKPNSTYYITARPLRSGQPAFCSDASGVLKIDENGSVERCLTAGVPY